MERTIKQADDFMKRAIKYENAGEYESALRFYRESAEKMASLLGNHLEPSSQKKIQSFIDEAIKRGMFMKKKISEQKQTLSKKSQSTYSQAAVATKFSLNFECAEMYRKIANACYADVTRKEGRPKRELLQSAINAHIVEIEIKKQILPKIGDTTVSGNIKQELLKLITLYLLMKVIF